MSGIHNFAHQDATVSARFDRKFSMQCKENQETQIVYQRSTKHLPDGRKSLEIRFLTVLHNADVTNERQC